MVTMTAGPFIVIKLTGSFSSLAPIALLWVLLLSFVYESVASFTLWRVESQDGLNLKGGSDIYLPIGSLVLANEAHSNKTHFHIVHPHSGYLHMTSEDLVLIQTDKDQNPSCQSQTTNANTYKTSSLQQPAILSPYHFATSANTGHWTEQLPVGNGYLGAFTGGTVRHTIVPISVTNLFGYTNGHLAAEKQERTGQDIPPPGIYKELRTEFLQTGAFHDGKLKLRDSVGAFQGLLDLVIITASHPLEPAIKQPSTVQPKGVRRERGAPARGAGGGSRGALVDALKAKFAPLQQQGDLQHSMSNMDLLAGISSQQFVSALDSQQARSSSSGSGSGGAACTSSRQFELQHREWFASEQHDVLVGSLACTQVYLGSGSSGDGDDRRQASSPGCLHLALSLNRGQEAPKLVGTFSISSHTLEISAQQRSRLDRANYTAKGYDFSLRSTDHMFLPATHLCMALLCDGHVLQLDSAYACNSASSLKAIISIAKVDNMGKSLLDMRQLEAAGQANGLKQQCWERINKALDDGLDSVREQHVKAHAARMQRTQLLLPQQPAKGSLDIHQLLAPTLFQYGRYLLFSSGTRGVANLQGLWSDGLRTAWGGDYHLNINLQMAYWPMNGASLKEVFAPLLDLVERLSERGRHAARIFFGSSTHVSIDLKTNAVDFLAQRAANTSSSMVLENPAWLANGFTDSRLRGELLGGIQWSFCISCGAWMVTHLVDTVHFLRWDKEAEKTVLRVLKVLRGVALFFIQHMHITHLGSERVVRTGPTTSPENSYRIKGKIFFIAMTPAIDISILREISHGYLVLLTWARQLQHYPAVAGQLKVDQVIASKLAELVADLPNHGLPKISKKTGRVLEYPDDWLVDMEGMVDKSVVKDRDSMFDQLQEEDVDIGHRHFSGLHWLFPSTLHSPHFSSAIDSNKSMDNARLFEAADKFMQHKRRHNSGHTSWSASWEAALFARLHNGKQAHDALQRIASKFVTGNLLSIHPPLQNSHISGCITCVVERGWGNAQGFKAQTNTVSTYAEPAEQLLYLPREFETVDRAKFQVDGNSGYTAAVLETLCQSHVPNALTLLPALPAQWQSGQLLGVQGRGDVSIDMVWSAGKLTSLKLLFSSVHHPYWYSSEHYRSAVMKLVPKQAGLLTDDSKTIARFPVAVFSPNQLSLSARTSSECMVQWLPVDSKSSSQASNMVAAVLVVTIPTPSSRVCEVMLES